MPKARASTLRRIPLSFIVTSHYPVAFELCINTNLKY